MPAARGPLKGINLQVGEYNKVDTKFGEAPPGFLSTVEGLGVFLLANMFSLYPFHSGKTLSVPLGQASYKKAKPTSQQQQT